MTVTPSEDTKRGVAPSPARRLPEGMTLSVAAVFGAAMVLAALLLGRSLWSGLSSPDEGSETATETTLGEQESPSESVPEVTPPPQGGTTAPPTTESDPSTTEGEELPPTVACPAGTDPVICDAARFVQETRGRPFQAFPEVTLLADDAFDAEVRANVAEAEPDVIRIGSVLQSLGLLPPEQSYLELSGSFLEVGVLGFYDRGTGRLVVRGQEFDLYAQSVLVHELTHALDDQWFDIGRATVDDEADYGLSAVTEGNASRVDQLWVQSLDPADQEQFRQQEAAAAGPDDLAVLGSLPAVVLALQTSPSVDGRSYVDDLAASGGQPAIDDALTDPPTSSEQVLHPGLDRNRDPEIVVPVPAIDDGAEGQSEGRLGELLIRLWLGRVAGDGWGGDRYVAYTQDGVDCIRVDVVADSEADREDLLGAAEAWVEQAPDRRTVRATTTEAGDVARMTGCALAG